jgi:hypothetical protein
MAIDPFITAERGSGDGVALAAMSTVLVHESRMPGSQGVFDI